MNGVKLLFDKKTAGFGSEFDNPWSVLLFKLELTFEDSTKPLI